jgi:DNA recombination protein RmuC
MLIYTLISILIALAIAAIILIIFKKSTANTKNVENSLMLLDKGQERLEVVFQNESSRNRMESVNTIKSFGDTIDRRMNDFSSRIGELTEKNDAKMETIRQSVEQKLDYIQRDNSEKLEKMRQTVDEKLEKTLEIRLGEKFKMVSERLEEVHKGLGEMQTLASGVGDLKKVLTNVKTRGTWGEVQLGNLLEQILSPEQYAQNVVTKKGSDERVEFAIRLPGRDEKIETIWLPIDAKFPVEDYQKLIEAQDTCNISEVEQFSKGIEQRIKLEAKDIKEKYLDPPYTTDFGILFLPIEGLYAEILRRPGLIDELQVNYRVVITGPTTIAALLNSLQMGFRTLAIEKRSSEVWEILGSIKTEFGKFGELLDKTHKKLKEATHNIEAASSKTKTIEKKLKKVQSLPTPKTAAVNTDELEDDIFNEEITNDSEEEKIS